MPKVIVTGPDLVPHEYSIESEMTLGRHAVNEISIPEEKASRRHCRFRPDNGKVVVEDLDSSNGTKVNGRKVTNCVLKHGDTITIGAHTIIFQDETERFDRTVVLQEAVSEPVARANIMNAVEAPLHQPRSAEAAAKLTVAARKNAGREDNETDAPESEIEEETEHKGSNVAVLTFVLMLVVAGAAFYLGTKSNQISKPQPSAGNPPETAVAPNIIKEPAPNAQPAQAPTPPKATATPAPPTPTVAPAPVVAVPKIQPADPAVLAELNKALAERDRAIGSGNFQAARGAVSAFLTAHPDGEAAQRAQQELKDTETLIETSLQVAWNDAQRAAGERKYRVVTQRCTKLISSDPMGKYGKQARELLTQIDTNAEPRFIELHAKANEQIKAGLLDRAAETFDTALDELGGTKWSEQISSEQLRLLMARSIVRQIENERARRAAAGKPVNITLSAKKITGVLTKVNGLSLDIKAGPITLAIPLKDLPPPDLQNLLQSLNLTASNLELSYLWLLLGKDAQAQAELELALQNPAQAAGAIRLVNLLPNQKNLRIYDFSKWQHQMDWEAQSGSWSTQNDRYVLDSADGGETALKTASIGGPVAAKNLRIGFDFELSQPADGWFFSFELVDDNQHAVSATFNAKGLLLHANVDGAVNEKDLWDPVPAHVDISISGDTFAISINGRKYKSLEVPGLSALKGTLAFRLRETACAIDNVIIRNVE